MALRANGPVLGLVAVSLLAAAHAATHAVVRPIYQVSDEVVYLGSVQAAALSPAAAGPANACLAPPDGRFLEFPATTKPGFRLVNAWLLRGLCGVGVPGSALIWLRLAQSVSLAAVAGCAWGMAMVITGRTTDALLAGVAAASHPVAATVAGGVTPDAWANAFSALAFLAATRLSMGRSRWWDPLLLVAAIVGAYAWKDSTTFLLALPVMVLCAGLPGLIRRSPLGWLGLAVVPGVAAAIGAAWAYWFPSRSIARVDASGALLSPFDFLQQVVGDLLTQAQGLLASSWTTLGNFGASALTASDTAKAVGILLLGAALVGIVQRLATGRRSVPAALWLTWGVSGALCLVQPSVRQVLLGTQDIHQGRWLLPLLAPAAVAVAIGALGIRGLGARATPLWCLGLLVVAWSGLIETARYYWEAYPSLPYTAALFVRGTGGAVLDDVLLLSTIRHGAAHLPRVLPILCLSLLAVLSATCAWLGAAAISRQDPPTCPTR